MKIINCYTYFLTAKKISLSSLELKAKAPLKVKINIFKLVDPIARQLIAAVQFAKSRDLPLIKTISSVDNSALQISNFLGYERNFQWQHNDIQIKESLAINSINQGQLFKWSNTRETLIIPTITKGLQVC